MQKNTVNNSAVPTQVYQNQTMPVTVPVQQGTFQQGQMQQVVPVSTTTLLVPQPVPQPPQSLSPRPSSSGSVDTGVVAGTSQEGASNVGGTSPVHPHSSVAATLAARPNLRIIIPTTQGNVPVNLEQHQQQQQAIAAAVSSQSSQSNSNILATPLISVATPSLPGASNFHSAMPSAFPAHLNSAGELQGLPFNAHGLLSSQVLSLQSSSPGQQAGTSAGVPTLTLPASATNQLLLPAKREAVSPSPDAPSSQQLRPPSTGHPLSPGHPHSPAGPPSGHVSPNPLANQEPS